jgi:protein TonB
MNSTHFIETSPTTDPKNAAGKRAGKSLGGSFVGWGLAIVLSALLNITLFGLMPGLIHMIPQDQQNLEDIKAIQVIRIKRHETPPRKKELKKPKPKQEPKRLKTTTPTKVVQQKKLQLKPRLPFQLNPRLPATPTSLTMPAMEYFSMDAPTLKGLYEMGELDSPLTPLAKIPPIYPMRAMRRGIEGWVKIRFLVNNQGRVEQLKIIESDPESVFDKSVLNCVSQWKFKPGTVEGVPVNTMAETVIRFELEK